MSDSIDKKVEDPISGLDLGLSTMLLESSGEPSPLSNSTESVLSSTETSPPEAENILKNEFAVLASDNKWQELVAKTEKLLSESGDGDREARLWWIEGQLRLGSVPFTILAAPLDTVSKALLDEQRRLDRLIPSEPALKEVRELLRPTTQHAGALLREIGKELLPAGSAPDPELATSFFERAFRLDDGEGERVLIAASLEQEALRTSKDFGSEIERAARLRDLQNLKQELKALGVSEIQSDPTTPAASKSDSSIESAHEVSSVTSRSMRVSAVWLVVMAFLVLFGVAAYLLSALFFSKSEEIPLPPLIASRIIPEPRLRALEKVDKLSHLDTLYYELQGEVARGAKVSPSTLPVTTTTPPIPAVIVHSDNQKKEAVNTSTPVEDRPPPAEKSEEKSTTSDADWGMSRKESVFNGRTMRPTPAALDSVKGEQFIERYRGGKEFRVLARTRVMESPSFRAVSVTTLLPGDLVLVVQRLGDWLEIRSKRGNAGFVLAQDVEER